MATLGHHLAEQRHNIEAQVKGLVNHDLKELCRRYGHNVSGNKVVLQSRVLSVLDDVYRRKDPAELDLFRYRVMHHGNSPPIPLNFSASRDASNARQEQSSANIHSQSRPPSIAKTQVTASWKLFKPSPFYEPIETVVPLHELQEMPQNKTTVKANLMLNRQQVDRLRSTPNVRLMLYCGALSFPTSVHEITDVAFPNQIEVKVNGDDVKSNYKGLKNKAGSTKPADLTDKVRKIADSANLLTITYALTTRRFQFTVVMVKYVSAATLTERIKLGRAIPKERVVQEMIKADDDPDIAATTVRMSLKDPISTLRINLPVRSTVCTHNQCFDGSMFMELQEQAPQWVCPVCNKGVTFDMICVDRYFEEILQKTPSHIEQVDIEPNGEWRVIKTEEDDDSGVNANARPSARASYDDDFDDDLVEVPPPAAQSLTSASMGSIPSASTFASPATVRSSHTMRTPTISREASVAQSAASGSHTNKRTAEAVIDLTLSDEDEPPRPHKRPTTSTRDPPRHLYNTPHSLPDSRFAPPRGPGIPSPDPSRLSSNLSRPQPPLNPTESSEHLPSGGNSWTSGNCHASTSPAGAPLLASNVSGIPQQQQRPAQRPLWGPNSRPGSAHQQHAQSYPMHVRHPPHAPSPVGRNNTPMLPQSTGSMANGLRLPPLQTSPAPGAHGQPPHNQYTHNSAGSWQRSSFSGYSQSPDGGPDSGG